MLFGKKEENPPRGKPTERKTHLFSHLLGAPPRFTARFIGMRVAPRGLHPINHPTHDGSMGLVRIFTYYFLGSWKSTIHGSVNIPFPWILRACIPEKKHLHKLFWKLLQLTLPQTNRKKKPENGWLEYDPPFLLGQNRPTFRYKMSVSGRVFLHILPTNLQMPKCHPWFSLPPPHASKCQGPCDMEKLRKQGGSVVLVVPGAKFLVPLIGGR